ncbi:uncharacterized protein AC631_01973 [Debaryomyces fabryi]|uniref:Uncharacterized protein n=1 Tax=Debaryomyces fabryi TaxID=58627 RepID=A0A0V1Q167_9ASCO|nr:uncharacterized protein AC631_01973 [Debaryomyces fabryi]KSA02237.1 hypothetical protein AC631_01973 [Debaryomyces fabryi]CUM46929.1 unnamed protein product [Debaryomyces fabryi]
MVQLSRDLQNEGDNETVPLLLSQLLGQIQQQQQPQTNNSLMDNEDAQSKYEEIRRELIEFSKKRFWWFCSLGVVAIIAMHLSFLPRTSLSRDFRRWHGQHLTKSDVKRNYLLFSSIGNTYNEVANEDYISWWLGNFTTINRKKDATLIGADNNELLSYVKKNFRDLGFETETYSYDVPNLQQPISLSIELIDSKTGSSVYNASLFESSFKTPAYNGFGFSGNATAEYVYVNEGANEDFQLLLKNKIDPKNKIVIVGSNMKSNLSTAEKLQIAQSYGAIGFIVYNDIDEINDTNNYLKLAILRDTVGIDFFDISKAMVCPTIPSVPISFNSVRPILETLNSNIINRDFVHWHFHPLNSNPFKLKITTKFASDKNRKLTNVLGSVKGIIRDSEIIIGASRDSFTSSNPLSSHAVLFEIMRNFQRLRKLGWKPLRTIKFVSWDGTHNGLLGSRFFTNDTKAFNSKQPVLCYINIDGDAVAGSHFEVDSNPLFNHVLRKISKFIPIPKNSTILKAQPNKAHHGHEHEDDEFTTLHNYWARQNNISINNLLGELIKRSDALVFQNFLGVPLINIKFENDPLRDPAIHVPNSNYYSYDWLIKSKIDNELLLHGLLIRYIGLLAVSLGEREVIDMKTVLYFQKIGTYLDQFLAENKFKLSEWSSKKVPLYLLEKSSLYSDLKDNANSNKIKFSMLLKGLHSLLEDLVEQSLALDIYNDDIAQKLIEDFAWYNLLKKLKIFAQYKLANYRLLHFENALTLNNKDYQYIYETKQEGFFNHVLYGVPEFLTRENSTYYSSRVDHSIFPYLYSSLKDDDFELTIKWIITLYEKLRTVRNKIT